MRAHTLTEALSRGTGEQRPFLCPVHGDSRPSATVSMTRKKWYCVPPETKVMTADLDWVPIGDVMVGDTLAGFDEHPEEGVRSGRRYWRTSKVLGTKRVVQRCFKITLETGEELVSSSGHMWLVRTTHGLEWRATDELIPRRGSNPRMYRLLDTWEQNQSYDAGYVAAGFDGEGYLQQNVVGGKNLLLGFYQSENSMLDEMLSSLKRLGIVHTEYPYYSSKNNIVSSKKSLHMIHVRKKHEVIKTLGLVKPKRLMTDFSLDLVGAVQAKDMPRIVSVEDVGEREVVAMKTSTSTYVAEGFASHNCFTCGAHGNLSGEALLMEPDYYAMARRLEEKQQAMDRVYPESWLNLWDSGEVHPYWVERFDAETAKHFRLGYDSEADAVTYPLRDRTGDVLGVVRRPLGTKDGPKYVYPYGVDVSRYLFGYTPGAREAIVLVEGAMDAISLWMIGIEAWAIYGSRLSKHQVDLIDRADPMTIYTAFDNDDAGFKAHCEVERAFRHRAVSRVTWPASWGKDVDEIGSEKRQRIFSGLLRQNISCVECVTCESSTRPNPRTTSRSTSKRSRLRIRPRSA